jgi:hypothetical protein
MSTQRREDGYPPATKNDRRETRDREQRIHCMDREHGLSQVWLRLMAWFIRAIATVGTAPPQEAAWLPMVCNRPSDEDLSRGALDRSDANSLQSDHNLKLVRQDLRRTSRSSPPTQAGFRATPGTLATRRSSLRLTPPPSELEPLHPFRSNDPAGQCRWTERYDGQRNLHLLNAA